MENSVHKWEYQGRTITFTWMGDIDVPLTRVYALAFTDDGRILLVGTFQGESEYWLPGGGIEAGESPVEALRRELMEEAAATVNALKRIGVQRVHDPLMVRAKRNREADHTLGQASEELEAAGPDSNGNEYQGFYWCRISMAEKFIPETEVTERRLVSTDSFLEQLSWGRRDPKAALLLELAKQFEQQFGK